MAGLFDAFLRGNNYAVQQNRQRREDEYLAGEREYQGQRRGVLDERQDTQWTQAQEDRARAMERDAAEYPLRFRSLEQGVESGELGLQGQRFQAERMPTVAAQQDEAHAESMAGARQNRGTAAREEARREQLFAFQMKDAERAERLKQLQTELGVDDAQFQLTARRAAQSWSAADQAARKALARGDEAGAVAQYAKFWNEDVPNGVTVTMQRDPQDGAWVAVPDNGGQPMKVGDITKIRQLTQSFTSPEVLLESVYTGRAGQGGAGGRASQPAALQEVEAVFRRLDQVEGESDDQRWMRAYHETNKAKGVPPQQALGSFYQQVLRGLVSNVPAGTKRAEQLAAAEAEAKRMTQDFARTFYPELAGRSGVKPGPMQQALQQQGGGGSPQPTMPSPSTAMPGGQQRPGASPESPVDAASLPGRPPAGTWVRLPDGRVVQVQ